MPRHTLDGASSAGAHSGRKRTTPRRSARAVSVNIPGWRQLSLSTLVLDFNGTLALDGRLIRGVTPRLRALRRILKVHVLTADTFGTAAEQLRPLSIPVTKIGTGSDKARVVRALPIGTVAAIGNGRNDGPMLRWAALRIAIIGPEGGASETIKNADVIVPSITAALDLLLHPQRLVATLRS